MTRHALLLLLACLEGCDWSLQRMVEQERCARGQGTSLFADGSCAQPMPEGVVPFDDSVLARAGAAGDEPAQRPSDGPPTLTRELLEHGRDRYDLFCTPCHGLTGTADTPVARRMSLRPPPSLHERRVRDASDETIFSVISGGYGLMPSYGHVLDEQERWAVVAYVRVLERSQHLTLGELPGSLREEAQRWLP